MRTHAFWLLALSFFFSIGGYVLALVFSCNSVQTHAIYCDEITKFTKYYVDNIRGHLFTGFLALGGFLLSLKTFIIVTMKENVYDDEKYIENWKAQRKLSPNIKLYAPLKQLSDFLYYAIFASILAAVLQMSLGLYEHWFASAVSVWSAVYATILLVWCLVLIKRNLDTWFSYLDS